MPPKIPIDREKIAELCRKHHIRKLWLFGSILRDDFREDSDVDVLVSFQPEHIPGFGIFRIEEGLSELLGAHRVDLVLEEELNPRIKHHRYFMREVVYDEG